MRIFCWAFERATKIGLLSWVAMGLGKPYFIGVFQRQSNLKIGLGSVLKWLGFVKMALGQRKWHVWAGARAAWSSQGRRTKWALFSNGLHPHHHHHNDPEALAFATLVQLKCCIIIIHYIAHSSTICSSWGAVPLISWFGSNWVQETRWQTWG